MAQERSLHVELKATDNITKAVKTAQSSIIRFVGAVSSALVSIRAISFPVESSADFERALADVAKTTNFTALEMDALSSSLVGMSKNMSLTAVELANIAAAAGQLGLGSQGVEAIEQFTESVARATVTFGLGEEQVSQYAAQILQVFNVPTGKVENLFSQINELSNNSVASAEFLLDVMRRVGTVAGLSVQEVGALAASVADFGVTAEVGGTTLVKIFSNMETKVEQFSRVLNISSQEWATAVQSAPLQAFQRVSKALDELDGVSRSSAIKELFGEGRIFSLGAKFVNDAANGFEILNKNVSNSDSAFKSGQSSIAEYEKVVTSFNEQLKITKNSFVALAIESGQALLPKLKEIAKELQNFLDSDAARDTFEQLITYVGQFVSSLQEGVKLLVEYSSVWDGIITLLQVFVAFQIVKVFLHLADALGASLVKLTAIKGGWTAATAAMKDYYSKSLTAQSLLEKSQTPPATGGLGQRPNIQNEVYNLRGETDEYRRQLVPIKARLKVEKDLIALRQKEIQLITSSGAVLSQESARALGAKLKEIEARKANIVVIAKEQTAVLQKYNDLIDQEAKFTKTSITNAYWTSNARKATQELAATQTLAARATASLAASTAGLVGALKGLVGAAKAVGGVFARFIFGPWGTFLITLAIFKDEILSFFGFVVDEGDKAITAATRRSEERMRKHAESLVAAYEKIASEYLKRVGSTEQKDLFTSGPTNNLDEIRDTQGIEAYQDALKKSITTLKSYSEAASGGAVRTAQLEENLYETRAEANRVTEELDNLEKAKKKLQDKTQRGGRSTTALSDRKQLGEVNKQIAEYTLRLDALQEVTDDYERQLGDTLRAQSEIIRQRDIATSQLASRLTDRTDRYLDAYVLRLQQLQKITELTDERNKALAAAEAPASGVSDIRSRNANAENAQKLAVELAKVVEAAKKSTVEINKIAASTRNIPTELDIIDTIKNLGGTVEDYIRLQEKADKVTLKSAQGIQKNYTDQIIDAGLALEATKRLQKAFTDLTGPLRAAIAQAKSVYANLASSNNAAAKSVRELGNEFDELFDKQSQDLADDNALSQIETNARQEFDIQKSYYERLAKVRRAAGDEAGATRAEGEISNLEKQLELKLELEKVDQKQVRGESRFNEISSATKEIAKDLQELQNFDLEKFLSGEKAKYALKNQKQITEEQLAQIKNAKLLDNQQKITLSTEKLQRYKTEAENIGIELGNLAGTKVEDPFSGIADSLFSEESKNAIKQNTTKLIEEINTLFSTGVTLGNTFANTSEQELNKQSQPLTNKITEYTNEIQQLQEVTGYTAGQMESLRIAIGSAVSNLVDSVEDSDYAKLADLLAQQQEVVGVLSKVSGDAYSLDADFIKESSAIVGLAEKQIALSEQSLGGIVESLGLISAARESIIQDANKKIDTELTDFSEISGNIGAALKEFQESPDNKLTINTAVDLDTNEAKKKLQDLIDVFKGVVKVEIDSTGAVAKARGGYIRGPGTPTSDSIPAWLSDKEYVIRAAAVRKFGVGFFDQLNSMRMPKFAQGGMVNAPRAALAGSRESIDLNFNIGGNVYPVSGDRQVVQGLASALAAMSRGAV